MEYDSYWLGLDLGQSQDFSCLAALGRRRVKHPDGRTDSYYTLRGLKRWPLGTLYTSIATDVAALVAIPPLNGCVLGVDRTGVGAGVLEIIRTARPNATIRPVLITAGHAVTVDGFNLNIPKRDLVAAVMGVLQSRRLEIPANIPEAQSLEKELLAFRARISTQTGHESFEADWRGKQHDDMVLAASIALWLGENSQPVKIDGPLFLYPTPADMERETIPAAPRPPALADILREEAEGPIPPGYERIAGVLVRKLADDDDRPEWWNRR